MIAIVGVGAIGGAVAACLAKRAPTACTRSAFDVLRVRYEGAEHRFDLTVRTESATVGPHDLVFVATKAHQTAGAADWLARLVAPTTTLVVLQNGVEHRARLAPWIHPAARVVPAVVDLPALRPAPGEVVVKRAGTLLLPDVAEAHRVAALFSGAPWIAASVAPDFSARMWRKLCVNVVSGAIPALTDRPAGVFRDPAVAAIARGLVRECIVVARAEGVALPDELADRIVADFAASAPESENAMLLDRRAGRPLESDARNGAVARLGARHGIDTPLNAMAAAILGAVNVA